MGYRTTRKQLKREQQEAKVALVLEGKSNYGKPRQEYADRIATLDEDAFLKEAEQAIWLSAYASNNRRSDYHWQCSACHAEAERRGKPELYSRAHRRASAQ